MHRQMCFSNSTVSEARPMVARLPAADSCLHQFDSVAGNSKVLNFESYIYIYLLGLAAGATADSMSTDWFTPGMSDITNIYDPGMSGSSVDQYILGKVNLRSNLSRNMYVCFAHVCCSLAMRVDKAP